MPPALPTNPSGDGNVTTRVTGNNYLDSPGLRCYAHQARSVKYITAVRADCSDSRFRNHEAMRPNSSSTPQDAENSTATSPRERYA